MRRAKHKVVAGLDMSSPWKEARPSKRQHTLRYVIGFLCVATLLLFVFRPPPINSSRQVTVDEDGNQVKRAPVSMETVKDECIFNLYHYHEVLTNWLGDGAIMTESQMWEEMHFSKDMQLVQSNGIQLDAKGVQSLVSTAYHSVPGWATKPIDVTASIDGKHDQTVIIQFKEIQSQGGVVLVVLDSVAHCRRKPSTSSHVDVEVEFFYLKEKVHKHIGKAQGDEYKQHLPKVQPKKQSESKKRRRLRNKTPHGFPHVWEGL